MNLILFYLCPQKLGVFIYTDFPRNTTTHNLREDYALLWLEFYQDVFTISEKSVCWWQHHQRYLYCQKTQLSTFVAAELMVIQLISASN